MAPPSSSGAGSRPSRAASSDPAKRVTRLRPSTAPPQTGTQSGPGLAAAALAVGGWLLLMVSAPVAIFLTWWGDCFEDICPSASDIDRAAYLLDFGAWLVLPALAFGAYRGWRWAGFGLIAIAMVVAAQVVAAILGARGFQAFGIVLPAAALIGAAGIIAIRPSFGTGAADVSTSRTSLIGLAALSIVVVAIAFQGILTGSGGTGQGLLILVAVSLTFVAVLAFLNRGRRPPPSDPHRRG